MSSTICVTDTSVIPFPTLDSTDAQTSITPLSHIPSARSIPPLSFSDTSISDNASEPADIVDYALQSRSTAYMRFDSGSSSSSSTPSDEIRPTIIPRSKRVAPRHATTINSRDIFNPPTPVSTPIRSRSDGPSFADLETRKQTPLRDASDEEDMLRPFPVLRQAPFCKVGKLRLEGSAGKHVRHTSDTNITPRTLVASTLNADQPPQTIRKKSGQPIKSSLKSARRPELHVVTSGSFAKSEPTTPTHTKAVHFDSKLEHVKLFLAEQKPLAVSRDGSPTSDTSGDEFPSFIYGNTSRESKRVKMLVPNMPSSPREGEIVALQELTLSQDQRTVTGSVRVRNIAYEKRLAVRFTLDWWQTTSEITARYDKSIEDSAFDIFTFTIRLHDIWSRIEDKTIFMALRYTVAGQEHWDNNAGKNYHIKFVFESSLEPSSAVDSDTGLKDLDSRLEDLAKTRSTPIPVNPYRLGRSFSADHQYSSFVKPSFTRYGSASVRKAQLDISPSPSHHTRTRTHPSGISTTAGPTVAPWSKTSKTDEAEKIASPHPRLLPPTLGSPRQTMDGTPPLLAHSETKPDSPSPSRLADGRERNHRRGFIERVMEGSPNLRRTPPGSPLKFDLTNKDTAAQLPRTWSYPLTTENPKPMNSLQRSIPKPALSVQIAQIDDGQVEEPTPYETSQSSSSSNSSCTPLLSPPSDSPRSDTGYKQFLDQFCFYTGADSLLQDSSETLLPRSQSVSKIEHCLSHSPPPSFSAHARDMPARFPFDSSNQTAPAAVRV